VVLCRNLTALAILAVLPLRPKRGCRRRSRRRSVESPCLVWVSNLRVTDDNSSGKDSAVGPTERHFHSEPAILPIFVQNVGGGCG